MKIKSEISEELKEKIIEAYIFASKDPVHISKLQFYEKNKTNLIKIINKLQDKYNSSGINLINIENCFAFRTSEEVSELLNLEQEVRKPLSRAASETLAIIAYHQPITRSKIESIRGVSLSKGTLDLLFEIGWIKIGKRLETPGRPITWETTIEFLDHFGLSKISDLPGIEELKESGLLNEDKTFFSDPDDNNEE